MNSFKSDNFTFTYAALKGNTDISLTDDFIVMLKNKFNHTGTDLPEGEFYLEVTDLNEIEGKLYCDFFDEVLRVRNVT